MFSKSDRICFQPTQNPPASYYEINQQQNAKAKPKYQQNVSTSNMNNNLPRVSLASPQLSAYSRPAERLKVEEKYRKQERRSFSYSQNPDISMKNNKVKRLKIVYQKHTKDLENVVEETKQLQVQGYYNSRVKLLLQGSLKGENLKLRLALQREKMKDKPIPPPGALYNEFNNSSIKIEKIPWRFQCFSSTVRRFSQQQQDIITSVGAYEIKIKSKPIGVISLKYIQRKEQFLNFFGVGSYDIDQSFTQQKPKQKQQQNFPCPFGSNYSYYIYQTSKSPYIIPPEVKAYIEQYKIEQIIKDAVNTILSQNPADPYTKFSQYFGKLSTPIIELEEITGLEILNNELKSSIQLIFTVQFKNQKLHFNSSLQFSQSYSEQEIFYDDEQKNMKQSIQEIEKLSQQLKGNIVGILFLQQNIINYTCRQKLNLNILLMNILIIVFLIIIYYPLCNENQMNGLYVKCFIHKFQLQILAQFENLIKIEIQIKNNINDEKEVEIQEERNKHKSIMIIKKSQNQQMLTIHKQFLEKLRFMIQQAKLAKKKLIIWLNKLLNKLEKSMNNNSHKLNLQNGYGTLQM